MFFDRRCPGCGRAGSSICGSCRSLLAPSTGPARLVPTVLAGRVESFTAAVRYEDRVAKLIVAGKNGGRCDVLRIMGRSLASTLLDIGGDIGPVDAVTWVPASPGGRRRRGYDQGRVLARQVGLATGAPTVKLLTRRRGQDQANRNRRERLVGPAIAAARRAPARVLLVDDVATTGATLVTCADALRGAGAGHVAVGVVAVVEDPMGLT